MKNFIFYSLAALFVFGCAKNRGVEPERLQATQHRLQKNDFTGTSSVRDLYYSKVTVVKNSLDGGFVFAGLQSDMRVGYFDFTEDKLIFQSYQGPFKGRASTVSGDPVLYQWPVTHHQPGLNEMDGKVTNKEFDDDRLKWNQKQFFVADFARPDITEDSSMVMGQSQCWPVKSRRRVDDSVQVEPGYISFVVEVVYQRVCLDYQSYYNGHDNYTVQYRYSFKKWEPTDYEPMAYQGELDPNRRKFGYFQSIKQELNPKDGRPINLFFVNRWDPKKQHHFFYTKNTPEEYKYIIKDIFDKTNKVFADIGYKEPVFLVHENDGVDGKPKELGDLRYSFVNIVDVIDPSAPLGYGPSDADPFTGEIISANLHIWSSSLKDYIRRIQMSSNRLPTKWQESDLYVKMTELLGQQPQQWTSDWSLDDKRSGFFSHMTRETTYGFPGYNSFAYGDGPMAVQIYADKPNRNPHSEPQLLTQVSVAPTEWVKSLTQFSVDGNVGFVEPTMLLNYRPVEETPLFAKLAQLRPEISGAAGTGGILKNFTQEIHKMEEKLKDDVLRNARGHCVMEMEETLSGIQPLIIEGFTAEEIAHNIIYHTAIHELGHNLNLRHNFYGNIDKANFNAPSVPVKAKDENGVLQQVMNEDGTPKFWATNSSSVMDYLRLQDTFFTEQEWGPYDVAALKYAYSGGQVEEKDKLYLFCTDENTANNALCNRFDVGTTPTQVMMSLIDAYEDGYYTRNYRDGRAYWNTSAYVGGIVSSMQQMKEFLPMWRAGFYESNMRTQLDQMGYDKNAKEEMILEMNREIKQAIRMSLAFYQAVLQQSNADKPFRSEFDYGTGALQRIGIGVDKQVAMFFMAGDVALYYNPNRILLNNSYMTFMYDADLASIMEKINENIVTQRVDMEPWFISYGRILYAQAAMNYSNREDQSMIEKIRIKRYTADEIKLYFNINLQDPQFVSPANLVTLTSSTDADFRAGEEIAVVRSNTNYYVFSKQQNPFAFDIYKNIKFAEENDNSVTEGQLDLQELFTIYNFFTTGSL